MPLITGVLHKADGTVAAGVTGKVVRFVPADGSAVTTADLKFTTDDDGVITSVVAGVTQEGFTLLPGTAWISAPVEGFSDALTGRALQYGRAVTIPDEAEVDFNDLVPAVSVTVSGVTTGQLNDLQAALDAEEAARAAADTTLTTAVTTEAAARVAADLLLAPLASPAFTGTPTAPTAATPTSTTQLATTAFVQNVAAGLVTTILGAPPAALDQLEELANALGDDPDFAATMATALAGKQPLDSDLTSFAALTPSNDDVLQRKAGAWTNRTPPQLKTDLALVKADVGLGNVTNDAQLKIASNLSDLANAATARTNLGLGTAATAASADLLARANHTGTQPISSVTGLQTAIDDGDAATLSSANAYTDAAVAGAGAGEQRLASVTFDLNNDTPQTLYTTPSGKGMLPTRYVLRGFSGNMNSADTTQVQITASGSATFSLNILVGTAQTSTVLVKDFREGTAAEQTPIVAAGTISAVPDVAAGLARTVTFDIFGYIYNV